MINIKISLFFTLLIVFTSLQAQNKYWSSIEEVNSTSNKGFSRPRIALDQSSNPVVIWGDKSNSHVYSSKRINGNWSSLKMLNPSNMTVFASDWAGPEIASSGDKIVVTFNALPENTEKPYTVISADGGSTFGSPVQVTSNQWSRFPIPAIDENGKPYVAFMEFDSGFVDPHYAVATSSNGGNSYGPSVIGTSMAPGEACDCCPAHLWAEENNVALLFRNNDNNLRDMWASVSTNSATSFTKGMDIDNNNWMINSCPSTGPDAIKVGDSLIAVWMSGASGSSRVNLATADIQNLNTGRNLELGNSMALNQNYPRIAGSGDTIGVVWQESALGKFHVFGLFSTTGIDGLLSAQVDTISNPIDLAQFNPDLAYKEGKFHITWQNNSLQTAMYRSMSFNGPLGQAEIRTVDKFELFPNPSKGLLNIQVYDDFVGGEIKIYDLEGKEHYKKESIDKTNSVSPMLSKGFYLMTLSKDGEQISSIKFQID